MQPSTRYVGGPEGHVAYQVLGSGPRDIVFVPDHPNNIGGQALEEAPDRRLLHVISPWDASSAPTSEAFAAA